MQMHSPTIIIFGATGNLAIHKIFPALSSLLLEGFLDTKTRIIAVSRRPWSVDDFRTFLQESTAGVMSELLPLIEYAQVDFEHAREYTMLARMIGNETRQNLIVYLSLAPTFFFPLIEDLRDAGILKKGTTKLLLEKPFGTSERSAIELRDLLGSFLSPEQVYPIDHYLGKATVQAIMRIHETDPALRALLSNKTVASVTVGLFESKGIEGRGASYDRVGALRDVGQNHMLEMLAVLMAEYPRDEGSADWQNARALVLEQLEDPKEGAARIRRGQYEGYRLEKNVTPDSTTETAFEVTTGFATGELAGVPVRLLAGKALPDARAFMDIVFLDQPTLPKRMLFEVQPDACIVRTEQDGTVHTTEVPKERDAYSNVLLDALHGERRHFPGMREVIAAWRYTDRLIERSGSVPLEMYSQRIPFFHTR